MQNNPRTPNSPKRAQNVDNGFPHLAAFNFDALFEMQRPALSAFADFNSKFVEGLTNFNEEWIGFVNTRLKEDLAVCKDLSECKSMQDVYGVYDEFYQRAMKHYQTEAEKITKIGKTLADDTIHSVQDHIEDISRKSKAA